MVKLVYICVIQCNAKLYIALLKTKFLAKRFYVNMRNRRRPQICVTVSARVQNFIKVVSEELNPHGEEKGVSGALDEILLYALSQPKYIHLKDQVENDKK